MNENIDLKRLKEELEALKQVHQYEPGLRRMAKDDVLRDAVTLLTELEQLRQRRYAGVFWLFPYASEYELLIEGVVRKDHVRITDDRGRVGFVLEGLTYAELCSVQVRRVV